MGALTHMEHRHIAEQLDRISASPGLQNAESLRNLLHFLVHHSLTHPHEPPKEHQIAVEVFHRAADFDPRLDSTVRVQTSRLRSKLAEYYSGPGIDDPVIFEVPKGSYTVAMRERSLPTPPDLPAPLPPSTPAQRSRLWTLGAAALLILLTAVATWTLSRRLAPVAASPDPHPPSALSTLWGGILRSPEKPLVVFSNAEFVGRPETGLRYRERSAAGPPILDHYTGVGEVMAIQELSQLFGTLGRKYVVKRSRLLNWDDTKNRDLIFIGSPSENLSLRELPLELDFRFEKVKDGPRQGDLGIANLHPQPGEQALYLGSKNLPITEDYAVVALLPGPTQPQWVLLLAGTTTFGTQAAAEFVCREAGAAALLAHLGGPAPQAFTGLLAIKINGGVPVETKLVAFHKLR